MAPLNDVCFLMSIILWAHKYLHHRFQILYMIRGIQLPPISHWSFTWPSFSQEFRQRIVYSSHSYNAVLYCYWIQLLSVIECKANMLNSLVMSWNLYISVHTSISFRKSTAWKSSLKTEKKLRLDQWEDRWCAYNAVDVYGKSKTHQIL